MPSFGLQGYCKHTVCRQNIHIKFKKESYQVAQYQNSTRCDEVRTERLLKSANASAQGSSPGMWAAAHSVSGWLRQGLRLGFLKPGQSRNRPMMPLPSSSREDRNNNVVGHYRLSSCLLAQQPTREGTSTGSMTYGHSFAYFYVKMVQEEI